MKHLFTTILIFAAFFANAQNITLDELVSLRKKNLVQVEEYLAAKGWEMIRAESPDYENLTMGTVTFAYNKSIYDDKAESFIKFIYLFSNYLLDSNRIWIQINNTNKYNTYMNRIKSFGCKLINSYVEDGDIVKVYRGATTTFRVITSTQQNNDPYSSTKTTYHFHLFNNEDF